MNFTLGVKRACSSLAQPLLLSALICSAPAFANTPDATATSYLIKQMPMLAASLDSGKNLQTFVDSIRTHKAGSSLVVFKQSYNGIDIYGKGGKILLNSNGQVVSSQLDLVAEAPSTHFTPITSPFDPYAQAVEQAFSALGMAVSVDQVRISPSDKSPSLFDSYPVTVNGSPSMQLLSVPSVKRVWFSEKGRLIPSYQVELSYLDTNADKDFGYRFVVADVSTSADIQPILMQHETLVEFSHEYAVFANENGEPLGDFQGPVKAYQPLIDVNPEDLDRDALFTAQPQSQIRQRLPFSSISTGDNWLTQEFSDLMGLSGNNVVICVPSNTITETPLINNCPLPGWSSITPTNTGEFTSQYDFSNPASEQSRRAAAANVFYLYNWLHDYFYDLGFDENAGNGQLSNFGRGGVENDPLVVYLGNQRQGLASARSTPDGLSPSIQMSFFRAPRPVLNQDFGVQFEVVFEPNTDYEESDTIVLDEVAPSFVSQQVIGTIEAESIPVSLVAGEGCEPLADTEGVEGKIVLYPLTAQNSELTEPPAVCDMANLDSQLYTNLEQLQAAGAKAVIFGLNRTDIGFRSLRPLTLSGRHNILPHILVYHQDLNRIEREREFCLLEPELCNEPRVKIFSLKPNIVDPAIGQMIAIHEWGHYLILRLREIGFQERFAQENGLFEGWSDFLAIFFNLKEAHREIPGNEQFEGMYTMSEWAFNNSPYFGPRRAPYSTDMSRNSLMFDQLGTRNPFPASVPSVDRGASIGIPPHEAGELWALVLLEAYIALLNDVDRLTFEQAQNRMMSYMLAGAQMRSLRPTFLTAKEAILSAAYANDMNDYRLMNAAFAKRGMGALAEAPAFDANLLNGAKASTEVNIRQIAFAPFGRNAEPSIELIYDVDFNSLPALADTSPLREFAAKSAFFSCSPNNRVEQFEFGIARVNVKNSGDVPLSHDAIVKLSVNVGSETLLLDNNGLMALGELAPFETTTLNIPFVYLGGQVNKAVVISAAIESDDASITLPNSLNLRFIANAQSAASTTETHAFCTGATRTDFSALGDEQLAVTSNNLTLSPSVIGLATSPTGRLDETTQTVTITNTSATRRHLQVTVAPKQTQPGIEYRSPRQIHIPAHATRTFNLRAVVRSQRLNLESTPVVDEGFVVLKDNEHEFTLPYRLVITP